MIFKIFLLFLSLSVVKYEVDATVTVTEVNAGQLAELPCLSSDDLHRFGYWQLGDGSNIYIIGPGNKFDEDKYNYEVLTGKLYIKVLVFDK